MKLFLKTKDFSVSKEDFELHHDTDMDMLITKPQPMDLEKYYESDAYISHTDANKTWQEKCYQLIKKYNLGRKLSLINTFAHNERTLLDVGAGTGDFLLLAKEKGWKTYGVEPNSNAIKKAADKGVELNKDYNAFEGKQFEVITLWHVLEHLPDLEAQIENILSLLKPNGTLLIAVPNFRSYDAKHYKKYWAAYDVPRHLWHFSKTAIRKLYEKYEWNVVRIKPMWFDAFYVALLSEQYKNGKQNPLKAFCVGLLSSLNALHTKECSSQLYIIQKAK